MDVVDQVRVKPALTRDLDVIHSGSVNHVLANCIAWVDKSSIQLPAARFTMAQRNDHRVFRLVLPPHNDLAQHSIALPHACIHFTDLAIACSEICVDVTAQGKRTHLQLSTSDTTCSPDHALAAGYIH